jgi:D-alanyl-lipoteichoic acid acyltransferase DltB (MBOAT superfamily)
MLFNSFPFLACFALLVIVYYAIPHRFRWGLLLLASLANYAAFRAIYVFLLLGITVVGYVAGIAIERTEHQGRRRAWLGGSVTVVLGALFVNKYYAFFAESINGFAGRSGSVPALPPLGLAAAAGLSFYSFSCVSYLADVHAARLPAERRFGRFALYISFFPKLLAGPLERARPFLSRLDVPVRFSAAGVTAGLQLMLWGLFKKVVIADRLAAVVDAAYRQPTFASPADLVIATYFFAFQLYCDFSGYSDIAIGTAKVLGFDLMENFRRPYLATTVREFWASRWHLSLSAWFRDYLYIPLGGSRVAPLRMYVNLLVVFLVSGLWHGANWTFVVWGGLNGLYQVIGLILTRSRGRPARDEIRSVAGSLVGAIVTFHLVLISWVFFRAATLADAVTVFARIGGAAGSLPRLLINRFNSPELLVSVGLIVLLLTAEWLDERQPMWSRLAARPVYVRWTAYYALLLSLIVLGYWNLAQFVYMQF